MMPRKWKFAPHDQGVVAQISREMNCSPLLAQVLASRGFETAALAKEFLNARMQDLHDPDLLPGAAEAADRVVKAIQENRRITIYGDYDVDGVTSTSILWHCLKNAGAHVDYYIPSRLEEGYGLNLDAIRTLHEEDGDRLLITVDCGICSLEEASLARELGMELIITDHHTMLDELPDAAANVHPRLPGSEYPFPELCGAGVAFKLAWAICQRLGDGKKASPKMREYLKYAVGLAAMGTVADVVPLVGENRIIVKYGLATLIEKSTPGLEMLMKVAKIDGKKALSAEDIGFGLAPRINAAGRLGQARLAVELLTTDNRSRAAQLADYLDQLNQNRQSLERKIFKEAKEQIEANPEWEEAPSLVLASEDWHPGVIGIVASRLTDQFDKPAVVIAINPESGVGQGSGRSFGAFDLHSGLAACSDHLIGFGGHKAAAGLRIDASQLETFRDALASYVTDENSEMDGEREMSIDAEVTLHDLNLRSVNELDRLGPFGAKHQRPVFSSASVELLEPPKAFGKGARHLSMRVKQGNKVLRCVAFGKAYWVDDIAEIKGPFSISYSVEMNEYRGYQSVELRLKDWQASESNEEAKPQVSSTASKAAS